MIAHPDDESMFFSPVLKNLRERNTAFPAKLGAPSELQILCLSSGNADGIGHIRRKELIIAAEVFGIPANLVHVVDHPGLQDGMENEWSEELVANEILAHLERIGGVDLILTFDAFGVSGHKNHIAVFHGVRKSLKDLKTQGWALESTNIVRKYSGILDVGISWLISKSSETSNAKVKKHVITVIFDPLLVHSAMKAHYSQFVWFRKLFIVFSRFSFVNSFVPILPN